MSNLYMFERWARILTGVEEDGSIEDWVMQMASNKIMLAKKSEEIALVVAEILAYKNGLNDAKK